MGRHKRFVDNFWVSYSHIHSNMVQLSSYLRVIKQQIFYKGTEINIHPSEGIYETTYTIQGCLSNTTSKSILFHLEE